MNITNYAILKGLINTSRLSNELRDSTIVEINADATFYTYEKHIGLKGTYFVEYQRETNGYAIFCPNCSVKFISLEPDTE